MDTRVKLTAVRDQLIALLYGQLAGAASLREIEASGQVPHRSTLADANRM
ncbi:MAG: DUF4372 domain-containing protein, partial [Rhodoplanes sp.]